MTWLRPLGVLALFATACFDPSTNGDAGNPDESSTSTADDDGSATTTLTTSVSATTSTSDDDDDDTDAGTSATDPDSTDDGSTSSPADESTTDMGSTETGDEPVACNPVAADCGADEFCDAVDCVTQGVCVPRPAVTSSTMLPACGCTGTSYWNVEHAHWLGATAFETDLSGCGNSTSACDVDGDCADDGASCVTDHGLGPASCEDADLGRCWAIPPNAACDDAPLQPEVGFGSCSTGPDTCDASYLVLCEAMLEGDYFAICL